MQLYLSTRKVKSNIEIFIGYGVVLKRLKKILSPLPENSSPFVGNLTCIYDISNIYTEYVALNKCAEIRALGYLRLYNK